jgi:uncharacterized iron-regulated membrane protein
MKETFFRSMTWLHTWVGLTVCWLLLLIFFAGTLSFFRPEISLWMQPAFHQVKPTTAAELQAQQFQLIEQGVAKLAQQAPTSGHWFIELPDERTPLLGLSYEKTEPGLSRRDRFQHDYYDPATMEKIDGQRQTRGGDFFYRLHFDLHYLDVLTARWLVGFASLFMLIALISGVVIHKRIFADLFSFRANKGSRSWLDLHNVSSVLALPFHLMITYTGIITLIFMYFPYAMLTTFDGDFSKFYQQIDPTQQHVEATGQKVAMADISLMLQQIQQQKPDIRISRVTVEHPYDSTATLLFSSSNGTAVRDQQLRFLFNGQTAALMAQSPVELSASETFFDSMTALHTGRLAQPLLRWLYFFCGVAGCVMIASGCMMWAKRIRERLKQPASFGLRLVETLNLGTVLGLPLASAGYFYANRLLPMDLPGRAQWEIHTFFLCWLALLLLACWRRDQQSWRFGSILVALALAGVPLLNALTTDYSLLGYLQQGQWALAGLELTCLLFALFFLLLARGLSKLASPQSDAQRQSQRVRPPLQELAK